MERFTIASAAALVTMAGSTGCRGPNDNLPSGGPVDTSQNICPRGFAPVEKLTPETAEDFVCWAGATNGRDDSVEQRINVAKGDAKTLDALFVVVADSWPSSSDTPLRIIGQLQDPAAADRLNQYVWAGLPPPPPGNVDVPITATANVQTQISEMFAVDALACVDTDVTWSMIDKIAREHPGTIVKGHAQDAARLRSSTFYLYCQFNSCTERSLCIR